MSGSLRRFLDHCDRTLVPALLTATSGCPDSAADGRASPRLGHIPVGPSGPWHLTSCQFRRTLAWYIARRPGGIIAGAVQYGHVLTQTIKGCAGQHESGFPDEVLEEMHLAREGDLVDSLATMADRIIDVSGREGTLGPCD